MKYKKELLLVLVIAGLLRLAPVCLYGFPLGYDAPFHLNMSQDILGSNSIPEYDPVNNYPPLYHVALASLSLFAGVELISVLMVLLPVFSVLTVLSVFVLVKRINNERNAVIAALLLAVASPLIGAAYDSPENVVFFLLPLLLLLFYMKRNILPSLLYASFLLWNYFAFLITAIPLLLTYARKIKNLKYLIAGIVLVLLFHLATKGIAFFDFGNLSGGMFFVMHNLRDSIVSIVAIASIFTLPLLYLAFRDKYTEQKTFWVSWICISYLSLVSFFITPIFRAWEQLKFLALASVVAIGLITMEKWLKRFILIFGIFLVFSSLVVSFQMVFPRITPNDLHAIEFLAEHASQETGMILAAPAFSEYIKHYTDLDAKLVTSLYYENAARSEEFEQALHYLSGEQTAAIYPWVLLNFEDNYFRNTGNIVNNSYLSKVYSLKYEIKCPFLLFYSTSPACGMVETAIFHTS